MSFELKQYQKECLAVLERFFCRTVETGQPAHAFFELAHRNYLVIDQLPGSVMICLRVPTGGGKTFLAASAVGVAARHLFHREHLLVLWLAPSTPIVDQTLTALSNRKHPYRQALDAAFGGNVHVTDATGAQYLTPGTLEGNTTIIVATLQSLRTTDTEGRKFYEQNGYLMPHFTGLSDEARARIAQEEFQTGDTLVPSLANLMRLHRPLVIMDEAHNAKTELSVDTLQRLDPACILELTATPEMVHDPKRGEYASNILHHVSALELKEEAMIKLPIKLRSQRDWKRALQEAIARQAALEQAAQQEEAAGGKYIRPIVLVQAQPESKTQDTITPEVVRKTLLEDFSIPEAQIAVATGRTDDLGTTNLFLRDCPIRYIITVQKLREGWDCSFAYILCSLSSVATETAVEQILGRVLRQPYATHAMNDALNVAYAIITQDQPYQTASALAELLEKSAGFGKFEAQQSIQCEPDDEGAGPLFSKAISVPVTAAPDLSQVSVDIRAKLEYRPEQQRIVWTGLTPPTQAQLPVLERMYPDDTNRRAVRQLVDTARDKQLGTAAQGQLFEVPQLAVRETSGRVSLFEDQHRDVDWQLAQKDASLSRDEFTPPTEQTRTAVIDVDGKSRKMTADFITEMQPVMFFADHGPQSESELVAWLARSIHISDIVHGQKVAFLTALVRTLRETRNLTLPELLSARFTLLQAAEYKIRQHGLARLRESYQQFLAPDFAPNLEVSTDVCFRFPLRSVYPATRLYTGPNRYPRHYYNNIAEMNGEEAQCALLIDHHPKVVFWVRNLIRPDFGFWLQTSTDKFYPDFVARLNDGRSLVVEYKGQDRIDNPDTLEKDTIGKVWADHSHGQCLFLRLAAADMAPRLAAL